MRLLISKLAIAFLALSAAQMPCSAEKGWSLVQDTQSYGGQEVNMSAKGLRMKMPYLHISLATHAPDWKLFLYNDKTKRYCELSNKDWKELCAANFRPKSKNRWVYEEVDPVKIAGLPTRHFQAQSYLLKDKRTDLAGKGKLLSRQPSLLAANISATNQTRAKQPAAPEIKTLPNSDAIAIITLADKKSHKAPPDLSKYAKGDLKKELWLTKELNAPTQVAETFGSASGLPESYGIPLKSLEQWKTQKPKVLLSTSKAQRMTVCTDTFAGPTNYKKVADLTSVIMDNSHQSAVEQLFDDSMETTPRTRKR